MKKFELGRIVYTKGIERLIIDSKDIDFLEIDLCLMRHITGDWGNLCEEDKKVNDYAVEHGERILSAYEIGEDKVKIWIITEWDRSVTTILLSEEY